MQQRKALRNKEPIAYTLQRTQLISSLPYIDQQFPQLRNNVQYLIKSQQKNMDFKQQQYLKDLQIPATPFIDSQDFADKVCLVKQKLESQQSKKDKKDLDKRFDLPGQKQANLPEKIDKIFIMHEQNILKEINLESYQKFGPIIFKESIVALQNKKKLLEAKIQEEKKKVQELNITRKYEHFQAREREQTIYDRTQVMMYKRRKLQ